MTWIKQPLRAVQDRRRGDTFREDVAVREENRKTGKLVAMAMVKSVRQLASTLVVAA
jgi:hypothetical protein